ncbi:MAG: outer membrane protein transport protein [Myxococcales bacterium]|nr:outer membrane protein transport protein [Myxococcales bacterium]
MARRRPTSSPRILLFSALLAGGAVALSSTSALASGLSTARFGAEHGHPTTDNPTATYYNPAGIALGDGTRIFIDTSIALRWASYTRPQSAISNAGNGTPDEALDANSGRASLFNTLAAPFAGVASDFGTDFIAAGASFSVPFGGQAVWSANEKYSGSADYPGAVDGVQRWYTIDGTLRSMYITGALAFKIKKIGLSIGVSGSAIYSGVNTIRARNVDGSDDLVVNAADLGDPRNLKEGRSLVDVKGWQGGFGVGAIWQWKEMLWIGASYTSQPNVYGGMRLKGQLTNVFATSSSPEATEVVMTQTLPDIVRLGVRVRPVEKVELRVFGDWTRWSVFDKQCVLIASSDDQNCDFPRADTALDSPTTFGDGLNEDGDNVVPGVTQHLPRFWRDGFGVRAGVSYWFLPQIEGYFGAGFDSSAVPVATLDPALMDMHKISLSLGGRFQIVKQFALAVTLTDIIYFTVDTAGRNLLNQFQQPTRQADANGIYKQNIAVGNLYLDISF